MKPKISIVMSTYNESESELKEAIDSIINQTFKEYEFIIILDNPKNEEHKKILNEYSKVDERIKLYINEKNIGLAATLNKGIKIAKSNYIARMDADDICSLDRLMKQFEFMENNIKVDILSTNKVDINEKGEIINIASSLPTTNDKIKKILPITSIINHSGAFMRKDKILKLNGYRLFPASQDYDLWLRALTNKYVFSIIDEPLIQYRVRPNNITNTNPLKQFFIKKYILKLYKMRRKNGTDNFSEENLKQFLEKNKYNNENKIYRFKKGLSIINEFKNSIKNKRPLKSSILLIELLFCDRMIKSILLDYIKVNIIKRRQ